MRESRGLYYSFFFPFFILGLVTINLRKEEKN